MARRNEDTSAYRKQLNMTREEKREAQRKELISQGLARRKQAIKQQGKK